ncbi:hypothetical protein AVEN_6909-1, partial [Araneus ventricosus]
KLHLDERKRNLPKVRRSDPTLRALSLKVQSHLRVVRKEQKPADTKAPRSRRQLSLKQRHLRNPRKKSVSYIPVVKRHDKYFAVTIKGKDINISVERLKPAYLLLTEVDAPHIKKLDTAPTLPNENQTAHQETKKQQSDLLDKDVQKKTTSPGRRMRFPARYKD